MLERFHEVITDPIKVAAQCSCFMDGVKGPSSVVGQPALDQGGVGLAPGLFTLCASRT